MTKCHYEYVSGIGRGSTLLELYAILPGNVLQGSWGEELVGGTVAKGCEALLVMFHPALQGAGADAGQRRYFVGVERFHNRLFIVLFVATKIRKIHEKYKSHKTLSRHIATNRVTSRHIATNRDNGSQRCCNFAA